MKKNMKYSAKFVKLAKRAGCVKYTSGKKWHGGMNTLDVPLKDAEILKYFIETSNWFLFEPNDHILTLMDMFFK